MSPIYVRPEREQAEHDRLIRFLQSKYEKFDVVANPGDERNAAIKVAAGTHFPDLVLNADKRLAGVVEIETAASVNNLETMAKWVPFSRARVPFHLYVPVQGYEAALRLAEAHQVKAAEIWTYRSANDGFDLVQMFVDAAIANRPVRLAARKAAAARTAKAAAAAATTASRSATTSRPKAGKATKPSARGAAKPTTRSKSKPSKASRGASATPVRRPASGSAKSARPRSARPAAKAVKKGPGARKRR